MFGTPIDFDMGSNSFLLGSEPMADVFVVKYDNSGNFVWAKAMGSTNGTDNGCSVAVDAAGNVITTGFFAPMADFDPGPETYFLTCTGHGNLDIFVSKLNSNGDFVWAKKFGGSNREDAFCVSLDAASNIYIAGAFYGTVDFDPGPANYNLTSAGQDIFLSKMDAAGNLLWAKQFGNTGRNFAAALHNDASGKLYMTGHFSGTIDFDPGSQVYDLSAVGNTDAFVVRLSETSAIPLPVFLLDFSVSQYDNYNRVQWKTSGEENGLKFIIERGSGNGTFSTMGTMAAVNTSSSYSYSFTDQQPLAGISYYRLKLLNADGSFSYSNIVAVNRGIGHQMLQVFPIPVSDILQVQVNLSGSVRLQIVDAAGRVVHQRDLTVNGNTSFSVNVPHLAAGKY